MSKKVTPNKDYFDFLGTEENKAFLEGLSMLNSIAQEMFKRHPEIPNYLEISAIDPDTNESCAVVLCKNNMPTPHQLRTAAELKLKTVRTFVNSLITDADIKTTLL